MNTPNQIDQDAVLMVWCNCPDEDCAKKLATGAISARLAACANLLPAIQSVYHWNGGIETAAEVPLVLKTTRQVYPALEAWLANNHPYEVPEIIALPVNMGALPYLNWVRTEVQS